MNRVVGFIVAALLIAGQAYAFPPWVSTAPGLSPTGGNFQYGTLQNTLLPNMACDGATDDTAALSAAVALGQTVLVPVTSAGCKITATISPASGQTILGNGGVAKLLLVSGTVSRLFDLTGKSGVILDSLNMDGTNALAGGDFIRFYNTTQSKLLHCVTTNAPGSSGVGSVIVAQASNNILIDKCQFNAPSGNAAVAVVGSGANVPYGVTISNNVFSGLTATNPSFPVRVEGGAYNVDIINNYDFTSSSEAWAVSLGSHDVRIIGNYAEFTGDNCISIVGDHNVVSGNTGYKCHAAGVYLWGSFNTVTGNSFKDGSYTNSTTWPCVGGNANYGAAGQGNTVTGNICDDDQAVPTQGGISFGVPSYVTWAASTAYTSGQYVISGLNIYQSGSTATSGATAPTCTSGTCSDGTITWTYESSCQLACANYFNTVGPNTVLRYAGQSTGAAPITGLPVPTFPINRNPDMLLSQPFGNGSFTSLASGSTVIDGWTLNVTSTKGTYQHTIGSSQDYYPAALTFTSSGAYTPTATDQFSFITRVEGIDIGKLQWGTANAKPLIIDIGLRTDNVTGVIPLVIDNGTVSRSYVTSVTTTTSGAWQNFEVVIPRDTGGTWNTAANSQAFRFQVGFGAGSNYITSSPNSWQTISSFPPVGLPGMLQVVGTSSAILRIAYVHLYPLGGTYISKNYRDELHLAETYYFKTFADQTTPGQNAGLPGAFCVQSTSATNPTTAYFALPADFSLMATSSPYIATITTYNPSASNANARDITAGADVAVTVDTSSTSLGKHGFFLSFAAAPVNDQVCVHLTVDSKR